MTTDTQLAPTDAEIAALIPKETSWEFDVGAEEAIRFARAVLAKLGAQPVVPVWTPASTPPKEEDGEVLVRMADGRCEIAWATYWHGSSNAFAQWTFRDPDEDEQPVEWMHIAKHGATAPQPLAREPLTPERVKAMVLENGYGYTYTPDSERAAFVDGIRHGEAAHGIT